MKTFATASVVLLFVLGASSARAGFDEGLAAHRRGDYATALRASSVRWPSSATRQPSSTSAPCKRTPGRAAGLYRGNEAVSGETVGPDATLMVVATPRPPKIAAPENMTAKRHRQYPIGT